MHLQNQWKPSVILICIEFKHFLPMHDLVSYLAQVAELVFGFFGEEGPPGCGGLQLILASFLKDYSSHPATGDLARKGRSNRSVPEVSCLLCTGTIKKRGGMVLNVKQENQ
jgi:hypothetical protein